MATYVYYTWIYTRFMALTEGPQSDYLKMVYPFSNQRQRVQWEDRLMETWEVMVPID